VTAELDRMEVVKAELVDDEDTAAEGAVAPYDSAEAAVLAALEKGAEEEFDKHRAHKTTTGYARDWAVWEEFHGWLAERTGTRLPPSALTVGTVIAFVTWLDEVVQAAPNTIDRRLTGLTVEARGRTYAMPEEATKKARTMIRTFKADPKRMARGRGQAAPATPDHLRQIHTADRLVVRRPGSRRRRHEYVLPELAVLRNRALTTMAFGISGRAAEVSALDVAHIKLTDGGLEVRVPGVKRRPARDADVAFGEFPESCPVLAWLAWQGAAEVTEGPAFRAVDQWGRLGRTRLSPDACRLVITRAGEQAGIVDTKLTGHSARAGFITAAIEQGKRPDEVRRQSGHAANSPVFWEYVRKAMRWHNPVSRGIGL